MNIENDGTDYAFIIRLGVIALLLNKHEMMLHADFSNIKKV